MRRMILASHGSLARGMKSAVEMIVGQAGDILAYDLDEYGCPEEIYSHIITKLDEASADEWMIVCDIMGGSVCNRLLELCMRPGIYLVTNMSLPLVLELYMSRETDTRNTVETAMKSARKTLEFFYREKINQIHEQGKEDEEEW